MEAATVPPEVIEEPIPAGPVPEPSDARSMSATDMFQFSRFVHVGPEADVCEDAETGACGNPLHFHAWVRLPNQFQDASIREKALAAKARKTRQLRDPNCDSYDVLEGEMDALLRIGERSSDGKQQLIEDIMAQTYWKDHLTAVREVTEEEEFKTIGDDQARMIHLRSLPVEERPSDEYRELEAHMSAYELRIKEAVAVEQQPERDALAALTVPELVERIRETRIDGEANEDFMRVFSQWEWHICTYKPRLIDKGLPNERVFGSVEHLEQAAPEVVEALEQAFGELENALHTKRALGNS